MTSDYGQCAGLALTRLIPTPNRDKIIARRFGVSVRMAKYLRAGRHWTIERLAQASMQFGAAFDQLLGLPTTPEIHCRFDEIEAEIADLRKCLRRGDQGGNG